MSYEDFEKESEEIRADNKVLLDAFEKWLRVSGLKDQTIRGKPCGRVRHRQKKLRPV